MTQPQLPAEPQPEPDATPTPDPQPAPPAADGWSKWFNRLMQTVGLGMVVYQQSIHKSDMWLLIMAGAMMLGGFGLHMFVRGVSNLTGGGQQP